MDRRFDALIAGLVLSAQAAAATFAPPLDVPMRAITEATRIDSGVTRRFTNARGIVFRRAPQGYPVEVPMEAGETESPADDPAAMFRAGFARTAGRTVVLDIDNAGRVVAVADQAAIWKAFLDGIAALAPPGASDLDRKRSGRIRAIVAALAPLPPDRQRATLASLVEPLIAADLAREEEREEEAPPRMVRVPASSAFGAAQLDGLRTVKRTGTQLEVIVTAGGAIAIQAPDGPVQGRVTMESTRRIDAATGLVRESREHVLTRLPDGSIMSERTTNTRLK